MKCLGIGLFLALAAGIGAAQAQEAAAGEAVFARCTLCHRIGPNAANALGPALNGLVGRKAGMLAGFAYSAAMKASGLTWDEKALDVYLISPKTAVPGNKMQFPGLPEVKDRINLIAYLKQFGADGQKAAR
jgi:cytochrome c